MARFHITRSFWHMARDLVVLIGEHQDGMVQPGDQVHLPGLGDAEVASVEMVLMAGGVQVPALIFPHSILDRDQLFEPATLEGQTIGVLPGGADTLPDET